MTRVRKNSQGLEEAVPCYLASHNDENYALKKKNSKNLQIIKDNNKGFYPHGKVKEPIY